jgi:hypothetical protein
VNVRKSWFPAHVFSGRRGGTGQVMDPSVLIEASSARILVAITAHFNAQRLEYLAEVLRSFSEYPVDAIDVVIVTNTFDAGELALLDNLHRQTFPHATRPRVRSFAVKGSPYNLTWSRKEILLKEFCENDENAYTHFMYVGDDIRITFQNFCYFVRYRRFLEPHGLIPSFLRVEYSASLGGFVSVDNVRRVNVSNRPQLPCGDSVFVVPRNPYTACYILDRALAAEYVHSASFDLEKSRAQCDWMGAERAAMGLCFENVPAPFTSRHVVPVSRETGTVSSFAWVSHLPNTYANLPEKFFGKVGVESLFVFRSPKGRSPG